MNYYNGIPKVNLDYLTCARKDKRQLANAALQESQVKTQSILVCPNNAYQRGYLNAHCSKPLSRK